MRVLTFAVVSCLVLYDALHHTSARAEDAAPRVERAVVLLFELPGTRPALCAALRIQLIDLADVRCRTEGPHTVAGLAGRIADASRAAATEHARLAVLLEADPDPARVRMILVGAQEDRAALAIESIEDRPAPDVDRSLALKVRDTLEVLNAQRELADEPAALALTLSPHPPAQPRDPAVSAPFSAAPAAAGQWPVRLLFEGGAALLEPAPTRPAGVLSLGAGLTHRHAYVEAVLDAQLLGTRRVHAVGGSVAEKERAVMLSFRAGRSFARIGLGGLAQVGVAAVDAVGITRDGTRGEQTMALARLGLGLDLRVVLWRGPVDLVLRAAPTLQIDPIAERLELDHQPALALGHVHAWLPLTFLLALPLPATGQRDG